MKRKMNKKGILWDDLKSLAVAAVILLIVILIILGVYNYIYPLIK